MSDRLERDPFTADGRPVRAHVRWNDAIITVDAAVIAEGDHGLQLSWRAPDGSRHETWAWPSAVMPPRRPTSR